MTTNTNIAVPAHIAARVAARQQSNTKSAVMSAIFSGDYQFPKISIRAGRYRLVEDGVETPVGINLDVIVVGANPKVSKVFYSKPYDGNAEGVRPDCFSNDGIRPDDTVEHPVCASCATCPHNALGSKITPSGAKSKLCADQRHLAVICAADPQKVYALTIPVSAMKNLREYFKELNNFNINPEEVITELGFDDTTSFPKITFKQKGWVPEKALPAVDEIANGDDVKVAVRLMAPSAKTALAAPAAAPAIAAPIDEDYADAPAPAPAPAAAAAADPAPAKAAKAPRAAKAETAPVAASSELERKLDSLFSE